MKTITFRGDKNIWKKYTHFLKINNILIWTDLQKYIINKIKSNALSKNTLNKIKRRKK